MHNASLHYPSSIFLKLTVAWQILLLNLSLCLADLCFLGSVFDLSGSVLESRLADLCRLSYLLSALDLCEHYSLPVLWQTRSLDTVA